jgi:hypothetical protein
MSTRELPPPIAALTDAQRPSFGWDKIKVKAHLNVEKHDVRMGHPPEPLGLAPDSRILTMIFNEVLRDEDASDDLVAGLREAAAELFALPLAVERIQAR